MDYIKINLLIISVFFSIGVFAQKKMRFTSEVGASNASWLFENPENVVSMSNPSQLYVGVTFSHVLYKRLYIETGLFNALYKANLSSSVPYASSIGISFRKTQMPVRLFYRQEMFNDRLAILASAGVSIMSGNISEYLSYETSNRNSAVGLGSGGTIFSPTGAYELGIGLECKILENIFLGCNVRTLSGDENMFQSKIRVLSDTSLTNYEVKTGGSFTAFTFTLSYSFGEDK